MSILRTTEFYQEVAKGNIEGHSIIHKFGHNPAVTTDLEPLCSIADYLTPQVGGATTLRVKAGGDIADDAGGIGAREVTFEGLDETGAFAEEAVATNGVDASLDTIITFMRLFRSYVSASGTYATSAIGSHVGPIMVENGAGGTDWGAIDLNGFPLGQSTIGAYSVPLGITAYLLSWRLSVESTKIVDAVFFQRENILETAPPYSSMRIVFEIGGINDERSDFIRVPNKFPALTDVGFMVSVSTGTADIDVEFDLMLVEDGF